MSRKLKNRSKKVLPKAQAGRFLVGLNAPRFTPPKIRPNFINTFRNYYPTYDIRGTGTQPNLFSGINELGMPQSNFANLTDYEKTAMGRFNQGVYQPIDPRFTNLVQNYQHLNTDKNLAIDMANMAVDFSKISPGSYFEVLTQGKPSPFMSEIFRDPNINVFNARNPAINDAEIDYGSYSYHNNLRPNFSGEFEKNLRSYGRHGFYANQVPLSGPTEITNRFMPASMRFNPITNYGKHDEGFLREMSLAPKGTYPYNVKTVPGYEYLHVGAPVADYVVNAGLMHNIDPITNLAKWRGRAEMDNQHNFLLGRTNSPSIIISGDQGFAGMRGGNDKRRLWSGIETPERGKYVSKFNEKIAPLLTETFDLNTPFQGTFMKFPYMNTYERTIDGKIPRTERINPVTGEVEKISTWNTDQIYKSFNDLTTDSRRIYKKNFDWLRPMSKENHFYPGTFLNQDGSPFNVDFDYTRGVLANPKLGQIDQYIPRHFLGFDWGIKPNYGLPSKYDYPTDFDIRSLPDLNKKLKIGGELPKAQWGKGLFKNLLSRKPVPAPRPPVPTINSNIYTKLANQRTHPVIGDYSFSSMQGEYDWLQNAGQMSDKFVTAKNAMYNSEGQMISYDMPNLTNDGYITLGEFFDTPGNENIKSLLKTEKSIDGLLEDINKQGLFHLDMHSNNIMVKPGFGGTILDYKIIDPVGLPRITPDLDFSTFAPLEFNQLKLNLNPTLFPETTQSTKFDNVMDFYGGIEKDRYGTILKPKKEGGQLPKAQFGRFKFSPKVRNKMTTDGNLLNTKKLDKLLQRNYTSGEVDYLKNIIKFNPSIVQGNFIDLNSLESLANNQAAQFKFRSITDDYDVRNIGGIEGRRTGWVDLNPNSTGADFNYYMYPELLPSHFSYINQGNTPSSYMQFKGDQVLPTNFSIGMTGLNKPFLDSHHDGLHILDPGAHGWMRGFVDQRFPNRYNLKELQTDINKDPLFTGIANKNVFELYNHLDKAKYRTDKYDEKILNLENELATVRNRKNEIYGLDEHTDEFLELESKEQSLMQSLEYAKLDFPTARRLMENTGGDMNQLIQMSRIGFDPYSRLNNEAFSFLQNKGFNQIVLPNNQTIGTIQGWDPSKPHTKGQLGSLNYYNTLPNNPQLRNTGNTFNLDNYTGNIFDLQSKPFPLFKEYGGQTSTYALDTKHSNYKKGAEVYKYGGQSYNMEKAQKGKETNTFDQEYGMFENWLQEQEASWDYIKNTPSSVLKPDGKTYYMMFEDNKFYPYYFKNSDGTVETEATVGFGMKGADVYETYKDGMSLEEAETGRKTDIDNALRKTKIFIDANYGEGSYDKLDDREKFMLADFTYNLGRLSKYPKFADAIMTNNFDEALAQYIRKDQEGGTELARNDAYLNTYLQPWIDSEQERIAEEAANVERMNKLMQEQLVIPADNTMVGQNSFGGWKAGGETNKNKKMKTKDLAYFKNGGNLPKAQNGLGNFSLLNTQPYNPLMDQMRRMIHQNRIDTYYEPAGGQSRYNELQAWAQYQNALASGNESVINAYKTLYPDFANLSYGDAFSMSRDATELAFNMDDNEALNDGRFRSLAMPYGDDGMPNFRWNNQVHGVEEADDNIFDWRTSDQIQNIGNQMDQDLNMDFLINNPDLANAEPIDYYNYMVEYYKDDKEKTRLLRDIKKNNPDTYLDLLSPSKNAALYNQFRTHQGLDPSLESVFNNTYDPNNDEPVEDFDLESLYNTEINYVDNIGGGAGFTSMSGDHGHAAWQQTPLNFDIENLGMGTNQHAVDAYLSSDAFNKGPKAAENWLKEYNAKTLKEYKEKYGKSYFTSAPANQYGISTLDEETYNKFLEYEPGQTGENRNPLFENIYSSMNNQILENNIGSAALTYNNPNNNEESILNYGNADIPEYLKDRRMALLDASGDRLNAGRTNLWGQQVPVINERSNQPLSWYERNISKPWNDLGNWANAPTGAPPLSGFLYNTLDWAGDIARPILANTAGAIPIAAYESMFHDENDRGLLNSFMGDAQYYMPGKRLWENPNWGNAGMVGLDAVSVIPVGRLGSMTVKGLQGGLRNSKFLTTGLNTSKGIKGNYNTLLNNYSDLRYMNPKLKNMYKFDAQNPGLLRNTLNQKGPFTVNTPAGRQYNLTGNMFSSGSTPIGKTPIDYGTAFDKYKHFGTVPGYIGTSFIEPNRDISFTLNPNVVNVPNFNPNLRTTTIPKIK